MDPKPVSSSNVACIAYDPDSKTLEVAFHNGGVYQYAGVPAHHHQALLQAPSIGGYLHKQIKGTYPHTKVG